jgi:hypothetical protein
VSAVAVSKTQFLNRELKDGTFGKKRRRRIRRRKKERKEKKKKNQHQQIHTSF